MTITVKKIYVPCAKHPFLKRTSLIRDTMIWIVQDDRICHNLLQIIENRFGSNLSRVGHKESLGIKIRLMRGRTCDRGHT